MGKGEKQDVPACDRVPETSVCPADGRDILKIFLTKEGGRVILGTMNLEDLMKNEPDGATAEMVLREMCKTLGAKRAHQVLLKLDQDTWRDKLRRMKKRHNLRTRKGLLSETEREGFDTGEDAGERNRRLRNAASFRYDYYRRKFGQTTS